MAYSTLYDRGKADQVLGITSTSSSHRRRTPKDFILISEFSELEGPLALAVVAASTYIDLKEEQHLLDKQLQQLDLDEFDFNAFALRVVSVDQTAEQLDDGDDDHHDGIAKEDEVARTFSIPDDTQVYTTDSKNHCYAFTHHLTLFDINARGYVHPVALSYITCDPDKMLTRFEDYTERFDEVARLMKKGNFSNFAFDLKCRLVDLEHTQSVLKSKPNPDISSDAMQQAITVTRLMIDTVESYVIQLLNEPLRAESPNSTSDYHYSRKSSEGYQSTPGPMTPNSISDLMMMTAKDDKEYQQQKQDTSPPPPVASVQPLAIFTQGHENPSNCLMEPGNDYKPKYIETLHPVAHFERKLRSLAQLCQEPHHPPQQQQHQQQQQKEPSSSSASNDPSLSSSNQHRRSSNLMPEVIPLVSAIEPKIAEEEQLSKPTFASTITHDMYAEAIRSMMEMTQDLGCSSEMLDLVEDEAAYLQPYTGTLSVGGAFIMNMRNPQPKQAIHSSSNSSSGGSISHNTITNNPATTTAVVEKKTQEQLPAIDETEYDDDNNDQGCKLDDDFSAAAAPRLFSSPLWQHHQEGHTHIDTLKHLRDILPHAIFTLLTGRPVVILGKEDMVQKAVQALSVFVPGAAKTQRAVVPWYDGQLTDIELGSFKLVGAASVDASIYKLDISCLDLDSKQPNLITSPLYLEGQWVTRIVESIIFFSSDKAWRAHLQTILMEMALKAFIYHYMYTRDSQSLAVATAGLLSSSHHHHHPSKASRRSSRSTGGEYDSSSSDGGSLARRWSVRRIMSYLRRIEERQGDEIRASLSEMPLDQDAVYNSRDLSDGESTSDTESSSSTSSAESNNADGIPLIERRGRRFLAEKLGVHGDDQNIVIYFASLTEDM
ncbi:hypothetical protein O0I10_002447 [Lichtheimia ornata]|uniref:UDENN FLCN/SMCR8-type domain-containing protein n=1 Tax=Lichtheimia ornata TaxID=688661 RepID=A0AAD7Y0L2_9FUNG|nr:uncharacterized protein O0I10_002447 [Lichtheimia ornata]KAJ8661640.1 hypothetical protein O0I10_002447 [Lichtheimia ornata]